MTRTCIAIVDAARARLFTLEELARQAGTTYELRERADLIDPDRRLRPSELFSDTRPGADRAPGGRGHAVDDHRDSHLEQLDRRFAGEVAARVASLVREHSCGRLIVAASPRMLGHLRRAGAGQLVPELAVDEIDRDLTRSSPPQIHDLLTARGLLPARGRLTDTLPQEKP